MTETHPTTLQYPIDQRAFARAAEDWLRERKAIHALRFVLSLIATVLLVLRERNWEFEHLKPDLQFILAAVAVAVAFEVVGFLPRMCSRRSSGCSPSNAR
jgi:hypothetical protein